MLLADTSGGDTGSWPSHYVRTYLHGSSIIIHRVMVHRVHPWVDLTYTSYYHHIEHGKESTILHVLCSG